MSFWHVLLCNMDFAKWKSLPGSTMLQRGQVYPQKRAHLLGHIWPRYPPPSPGTTPGTPSRWLGRQTTKSLPGSTVLQRGQVYPQKRAHLQGHIRPRYPPPPPQGPPQAPPPGGWVERPQPPCLEAPWWVNMFERCAGFPRRCPRSGKFPPQKVLIYRVIFGPGTPPLPGVHPRHPLQEAG